jgi:cell division protein FtsW (lipid II flippase)
LWAFCYLAAYLALRVELRNADSFRRSFAGYVVYLIVLVLLLLLLGRLVLDTWPSWLPLLNDAVASLLVFPLIFWLRSFFVTARKEPRERKAA